MGIMILCKVFCVLERSVREFFIQSVRIDISVCVRDQIRPSIYFLKRYAIVSFSRCRPERDYLHSFLFALFYSSPSKAFPMVPLWSMQKVGIFPGLKKNYQNPKQEEGE